MKTIKFIKINYSVLISKSILVLLLFCFISNINAQTPNWQPLPVEPQSIIYNMCVYNNELVCGFDGSWRNGVCMHEPDSNSIIRSWDGSQWNCLGDGISRCDTGSMFGPASIQSMAVYKGELYVGGYFDKVDTMYCRFLAKWDGTRWSKVGGVFPNGLITTMKVYHDELYIAGQFTMIGTDTIHYLAKWNGNAWIDINTTFGNLTNIFSLAEHKNKLFILGSFTTNNIRELYSWNDTVFNFEYDVTAYNINKMFDYKDKIYLINLNNYSYLYNYNDTILSSIHFNKPFLTQCYIEFNGNLILGGQNAPIQNADTVATLIWADTAFQHFGSGLKNYVYCMQEYKGELYCGGSFSKQVGDVATVIARYGLPASGVKNIDTKDNLKLSIQPNPANTIHNLNIQSDYSGTVIINLYNINGQLVQSHEKQLQQGTNVFTLDIKSLHTGLYYYSIKNNKSMKTIKFIKND